MPFLFVLKSGFVNLDIFFFMLEDYSQFKMVSLHETINFRLINPDKCVLLRI